MNNTLFYYYYNDNTKLKYPIIEKKMVTKDNRKLMRYLQGNVVSIV